MQRNQIQLLTRVAVSIAVCVTASGAWGRWMLGSDVPVDRLVKNVGAYVQAHPKDAEGFYTLGRIHSLAFANNTRSGKPHHTELSAIPVNGSIKGVDAGSAKSLPSLPGYYAMGSQWDAPSANGNIRTLALTPAALDHLHESLRNYEQAVTLAPTNPLFRFGLGFMYEQATSFPSSMAPLTNVEARSKALANYRLAYAAKLSKELAARDIGPRDDVISQEAGEGILRLLGKGRLTSTEKAEASRVRVAVGKLKRIPRAVTPILISFASDARLPDLLAPSTRVRFDLAGDGTKPVWPWVKPTTGILVWDPNRTGKITSGRQCFGSATWWMFWRDGYAPLAALDDNGDGVLRGLELNKLSVWFDRNGNGVSEAGEVVPVRLLGIRGIATQATGTDHDIPCNRTGVLLGNGATAATFDWTPTPVSGGAR